MPLGPTATLQLQSISSSSEQIRSKFFSRIGLLPMPTVASCKGPTYSPSSLSNRTSPSSVVPTIVVQTPALIAPSLPSLQSPSSSIITRPPVNVMTEPLKYDPMADAHYSKRRKTIIQSCPRQQTNNKKRIVFRETVQVVPIPMRNEYSSRVRSRLWTNAAELYENAARNTLEFAYEGWNWRKVTEDECMHVCVATGELIHPCHYDMLCKSQTND